MNKMIFSKTLIIAIFSVLFMSCSQQDSVEINEKKGDLVVLKLGIDGFRDSSISPIASKSSDSLLIEDLGNGLVLETQISPDEIHTKGNVASDMVSNASILAIVYKVDGTPYKYSYFTVDKPEIYLPLGFEFKIVFYSYNNNTKPTIVATNEAGSDGNGGVLLSPSSTLANNIEDNSKNVMWTRVENTGKISLTTKLPNLLFSPVFNRLDWSLSSGGTLLFSIVNSEAYINNTFGKASFSMDDLKTASNMTNIWSGSGSPDARVSLKYVITRPSDSFISDKKVFIAADSPVLTTLSTSIIVNAITIPIKIDLSNISRGQSYKITSTIKPKFRASFGIVGGAGSGGTITNGGTHPGPNGTVIASTATPDVDNKFDGWYQDGKKITSTSGDVIVSGNSITVKLSQQTTGKTYSAKFIHSFIGEVIGLGVLRIYVSGSGDDAKLMLTRSLANPGVYFQFGSIVAWPAYNGVTDFMPSNWNPSNVNSNIWRAGWTSDASHTLNNLRNGKGDPCRLVGYSKSEVVSMLARNVTPDNKKWRLPTNSENIAWASTSSGWTTLEGIGGRYFGVGSDRYFLPATGYRYPTTGRIVAYGKEGAYWTSTLNGPEYGHNLNFDATSVVTDEYLGHNSGHSIRCVPQ